MIAKKASAVKVPEFVPRSGVTIEVSDAEMAARPRVFAQDPKLDDLKKSMPKGGTLLLVLIDFPLPPNPVLVRASCATACNNCNHA